MKPVRHIRYLQACFALLYLAYATTCHTEPLTIITVKDLEFQAAIAGIAQTITTPANSVYAATFSVTGDANQPITVSVQERRIRMANQDFPSDRIRVRDWTFGGAISSNGTGVLDNNGQLSNIRLGASARVRRNLRPGHYSGSGTIRVVYQ